MKQSYVYVVKTDSGFLNKEFNLSGDIFDAAIFDTEKLAKTNIVDACDTLSNPKVVKVLSTLTLTPVI